MKRLRRKPLLFGLFLCLLVFIGLNYDAFSGHHQKNQEVSRNPIDESYGIGWSGHMVNTTTKKPVVPPEKQYEGYEFARRVYRRFHGDSQRSKNPAQVDVFMTYRASNIQLCGIWKVATTFLKRLFLIKLSHEINTTNPYDLSFGVAFKHRSYSISNTEAENRVMVVREPYNRLLSAYVDKLLAPNPVYWKIISIPAIKVSRRDPSQKSIRCGHDLTFEEFIQYVIYTLSGRKKSPDPHFELMTKLCKPQYVNYDFIAKLETFGVDALEIVRMLNMSGTVDLLKRNGSELAAIDALNDTVNQPFDPEFRKLFAECISVKEALQRAWRKLQIRGIIGDIPLNISDTEAENLQHSEFISMALKARAKSSPNERKRMKTLAFKQMYATLSYKQLESLAQLYMPDFTAFEYDPRPSALFGETST